MTGGPWGGVSTSTVSALRYTSASERFRDLGPVEDRTTAGGPGALLLGSRRVAAAAREGRRRGFRAPRSGGVEDARGAEPEGVRGQAVGRGTRAHPRAERALPAQLRLREEARRDLPGPEPS